MVLLGDFADEFCRDDGLDDKLVALHLSLRNAVLDDVIEENHARLVAIDEHPFAFAVFAGHAHAVGVGVACHYDVGINLLGQFKSQSQCFTVFGVRADNGWEVAALHHLLWNGMYVFKAPELERLWDEHHASAVQRGVDNLEVLLALDAGRVNGDRVYLVEVNLVNFFADDRDQVFVAFKLDVFHLHLVNFFNDAFVVWSKHLCTIIPVCLISVVFLRIVAGRQDNSALAAQMTNGERHFGSWTHVFKEIDLDAVCREDVGTCLGEEA